MVGIYKITNTVNGKVYIGQSTDVENRLKSHRSYSTNIHLRNAIKFYGIDKFLFEILEETNVSDLNDRERYWISEFDSTDLNKGYNLTSGGERESGWHHSESSKEHMREIAVANAQKEDYVNPASGTKLIHKGDTTSRCSQSDVGRMIKDGWELGPSEKFIEESSSKRMGQNNGVFGRGDLFRGEKNHFYGKHHTEETKQKIRDNMPDTSFAWRGKHHTEESKRKMRGPRPSVSGKNNPNFGKRGSSSIMHGRRVINDGNEEKRVKPGELDSYLSAGWKLGRKPSMVDKMSDIGKVHMKNLMESEFDTSLFASNTGKKLVSKSGVKKYVDKSELDTYLETGWKLGGKR